MTSRGESARLRVGFIGSGLIARFHLAAFETVRDADIVAVFSPTAAHRDAFAALANERGVGPCTPCASLDELLATPDLDAIWVLAPNHTRVAVMDAIADAVQSGASSVRAVACEKPLARTLPEAEHILKRINDAGLLHGYLENQVFAPAVTKGKDVIWRRGVPASGRPYLARAAEEHSGPHEPWFWDGHLQGGGVLSDMMCHSVEVGRHLLTAPDEPRAALTLVSANASVSHLKWTQPRYAKHLTDNMGLGFDFSAFPAEDFARGTLEYDAPDGQRVIVEVSTSWSFVGAGLRIALEMHGPEYAMQFDSLQSRLNVFLSRHVSGEQGEDLVEKQNSEQGLMPIAEDEAHLYGYAAENRHMVQRFSAGRAPDLTFDDGVDVVRTLMALYRSAELGRTVALADEDLSEYVPPVARQPRPG
ncbi:MAG: Gfo/Idh/MocA family oxidoreductase [Pseudomonadota bacterium]